MSEQLKFSPCQSLQPRLSSTPCFPFLFQNQELPVSFLHTFWLSHFCAFANSVPCLVHLTFACFPG